MTNKQHITTREHTLKLLGVTFDLKLTYNTRLANISTHTYKSLQIIKVLNTTVCDKQIEAFTTSYYKAVVQSTFEHASSIWSTLASSTNINKLQTTRNAALRLQQDVRRTQSHKTYTTKQKYYHSKRTPHYTHHQSDKKYNIHHTHYTNKEYTNTHRLKKQTTFNNTRYTININTNPYTITLHIMTNTNLATIHTTIVT